MCVLILDALSYTKHTETWIHDYTEVTETKIYPNHVLSLSFLEAVFYFTKDRSYIGHFKN